MVVTITMLIIAIKGGGGLTRRTYSQITFHECVPIIRKIVTMI